MPDPLPALSSLPSRYPRTKSFLYQLLLVVLTFECALSIARYDPNPAGSPPRIYDPVKDGNVTEHICVISAREKDVPVGFLKYIIPTPLLCPTTPIFIAIILLYILGIAKLCHFTRDAPFFVIPMGIWMTFVTAFVNGEWSKGGILVYLQLMMPINVWTCATMQVALHPLGLWAMPRAYGAWVEEKRRRREGGGKVGGGDGDVESGEVMGGQVDGQGESEVTPLTGRGFRRDEEGVLVEDPGSRDRLHDLYEEIRR